MSAATHDVVGDEEWLARRKELLVKEKELQKLKVREGRAAGAGLGGRRVHDALPPYRMKWPLPDKPCHGASSLTTSSAMSQVWGHVLCPRTRTGERGSFTPPRFLGL